MNLPALKVATVAALACLGAVSMAEAAIQEIDGPYFTLRWDDATTGDFGNPTLSANGLSFFFTFNTFSIQTFSGGVSKQSTISDITLIAKPNFAFESFKLAESGSYELVGDPGNQVNVTGRLLAFNTDLPLTTQTQSFLAPSAPLNVLGGLQGWVAQTSIDSSTPAMAGSTNVILSNPNEVALVLTNRLTAFASQTAGGFQFAAIDKSNTAFGVQVSVVPEASTTAMLAAGLGVLLLVGNRRRRLQD